MLNGRWLWTVCAVGTLVSGCMLNRSAIGCGDTCPDSGMGDAMVLADGDLPDADVDAFREDAGPVDSGPDTGVDAFMDDGGTDGGTDSGPPPVDAGYDTCADEPGVCLHFQNVPSSPAAIGWMVDVLWTHTGGSTSESGWSMASCNGGLRTPDAVTIECLIDHPMRPVDAVGLAVVFVYPVYAGLVPACSASACSNFPDGYAAWSDMVSLALTTEPRSGTPAGRITVVHMVL